MFIRLIGKPKKKMNRFCPANANTVFGFKHQNNSPRSLSPICDAWNKADSWSHPANHSKRKWSRDPCDSIIMELKMTHTLRFHNQFLQVRYTRTYMHYPTYMHAPTYKQYAAHVTGFRGKHRAYMHCPTDMHYAVHVTLFHGGQCSSLLIQLQHTCTIRGTRLRRTCIMSLPTSLSE